MVIDLGASLSSLHAGETMTVHNNKTLTLQDSIKSLLSLEDDDSEDEDDIDEPVHNSISLLDNNKKLNASSLFSVLEEQELNVQHVDLIRTTWLAFLLAHGDDKQQVGHELIQQMTAGSDMGDKSLVLVNSLDDLIFHTLGKTLNSVELDAKAQEWLEQGLDSMLLHKALQKCLEETLKDDPIFTPAARTAWKTTFGDVLHKMTYAF